MSANTDAVANSSSSSAISAPSTFDDLKKRLKQVYGDVLSNTMLFQIETWHLSTFECKSHEIPIKPSNDIERNLYEVGLPLCRMWRQAHDMKAKEELNKMIWDPSVKKMDKQAYLEYAGDLLFQYADSNNVWPPSTPIDLSVRKHAFQKWQDLFESRIHLPKPACESVFLNVLDESHLYVNEMNKRGTSAFRRACPSKIDLTADIIQREALLCARLSHFTCKSNKSKNDSNKTKAPEKKRVLKSTNNKSAPKRQKIDS
jgi:hypothetical protein